MDNSFITEDDKQFMGPGFDYLTPLLSPEYEAHYDCTGEKERAINETNNEAKKWHIDTEQKSAPVGGNNYEDDDYDSGTKKIRLEFTMNDIWKYFIIFIAFVIIAIIYSNISKMSEQINQLQNYLFHHKK